MRNMLGLGLTFGAAAWCCAAVAADTTDPNIGWRTASHVATQHDALPLWRDHSTSLPQDRLGYLDGSGCLERRGCSAATPSANDPRRFEYIDALDLGTYGPMKVKFTGDRVKLKVRF